MYRRMSLCAPKRPESDGWEAEVGQGWRSRDIGQKEPRPILCFRKGKTGAEPLRLRTEIVPAHGPDVTKGVP